MPYTIPDVPVEAVALRGVALMPDPTSNAERLRAYQRKLRLWREQHPDEYFTRLRKGLAARWKWHRLWERKDCEARQDVALFLRRASEHPAFGAHA